MSKNEERPKQKKSVKSYMIIVISLLLGISVLTYLILSGTEHQAPGDDKPGSTDSPIFAKELTKISEERMPIEKEQKEPEVTLEEIPVKVNYEAPAEEILTQYTEEGMSRFKLNYPDTFSMEYALKTVGKSLPEIAGKTISGEEFSTKEFDGKPFILYVSKTTCPVCEEMTPLVESFSKDNDIPIVTVYPVDKTNEVKAFFEKTKKQLDSTALVADKNDGLKEVAVDFLNIAQVPTLIFVDETGRISYTYIGKTEEMLMADMKERAFGKEKLYDFVKKDVVKFIDGEKVEAELETDSDDKKEENKEDKK